MILSEGDRLGPYQVEALLGSGGMGEVYRARDTRLGRGVAIKVLRSEAAASPDSRRRFEIEARAASALNHPNITTVYDVGDEAGMPYLVSELLHGESLGAMLKRGIPPLSTLLDIAVQVASGLAAAHGAGIAHRDLKPENLFVLTDGRVKILDFGLAKAAAVRSGEEDETRTVSDLLTSPGVIIGTIAYMSPEQCKGLTLDFRSDQFSFGTVLYEMATGRRPFQRADRVSTMAAIVNEDPPPVTEINPRIPSPLAWVFERCLAKEPDARYASTADLHVQLRDLRDRLPELSTLKSRGRTARLRGKRLAALLAAGGTAAALVSALLIAPWRAAPSAYRYRPFATEAMDEAQPAWSPDGQSVAYVAEVGGIGQVFTRSINSSVPAQITNSSAACSYPFWSSDGARIYYRAQTGLWSVGAVGGAPQRLLQDIAAAPMSISPDGKTVAAARPHGSLYSVYLFPISGGDPEPYNTAPFPASFRFSDGLHFSPDGKKLLAAIVSAIGVNRRVELWILPYPEGTPRRIPLKMEVPTGPRGVSVAWTRDSRRCLFSTELTPGAGSHIYILDTISGDVQPLTAGTGEESEPAVAPDGARVAFASGSEENDLAEISLDGTVSPLLATSRREHSPSWSPSGRQFAYVSNAGGIPEIWVRNVGENFARPLGQTGDRGDLDLAQPRFSPDGRRLAYVSVSDRHAIWLSNMAGGRDVPLELDTSDQHAPAWSPDGNWIVYARFKGEKWEIAKAPSGGGGQPIRIAEGGASQSSTEWSPSGQWICFRDQAGIHLVPADGGPARLLHRPAAAFAFSRDGADIYVIAQESDRHWELLTYGVPGGLRKKTVRLEVPSGTAITDISLHPDGKRLAASLRSLRRDIWILDGFQQTRGRLWPY